MPLVAPEQSNIRLYVTVDFEESFDWASIHTPFVLVGDVAPVAAFHAECVAKGIRPTYFATFMVLNDPRSVEFLRRARSADECSVGIHLHAWSTPPTTEAATEANTFQGNLPAALEAAKLTSLSESYKRVFGGSPSIHRAGRYGATAQTYRILESMGISLDFSPSSGFNFGEAGGPDFRTMRNAPFWAGDHHKVLCLPVPGRNFLRGPDFLTRLCGARLAKTLGVPVRLSPEGNTVRRMQMIAAHAIKEGVRDIVVTIHSTSLSPGGNPYSNTATAVRGVVQRLIEFVEWMKIQQHASCSLPLFGPLARSTKSSHSSAA